MGSLAYLSIAGLAASSDVGTASLLDGDGDCGLIVSWVVILELDRPMDIRMGTLRQLRPMRSSPLLQQAIFWPLPHLGELSWPETLTSVFLSEAPWGAAKATAATEAMMRDLKKAILIELVLFGGGVERSECGVVGLD